MLSNIDMGEAFTHYQRRDLAHHDLVQHFQSQNIQSYVNLALGITRPEGNYSAAEHQLGPSVLANNSEQSVYNLATQLYALNDAHHVPLTIYQANMPYLRISLGSEMAMLLNPEKYWVGNVRTIYSHLLLKHNGNQSRADQELQLYREPDGSRPSEMEYKIWRDLYLSLENSLKNIANLGDAEAIKQGTQNGRHKYMWADAICSMLYSNHA
jgi:hypothetical protein